jgi:hypothetical protein
MTSKWSGWLFEFIQLSKCIAPALLMAMHVDALLGWLLPFLEADKYEIHTKSPRPCLFCAWLHMLTRSSKKGVLSTSLRSAGAFLVFQGFALGVPRPRCKDAAWASAGAAAG